MNWVGQISHGIILGLGLLACLTSCDFFKKKDQAPGYLQVESITFSPEGVGGSQSARILDVWVQAEGQNIGTFGLPSKLIPILGKGPTRIILQPGVIADANPQTRVTYPFYTFLDTTVFLEPGKVIPIRYKTQYNLALVRQPFLYYEDFEQPLLRTDSSRRSSASLVLAQHTGSEPFPGAGANYGKMSLPAGKEGFIEMVSLAELPIPQNSSPVYLEFDINTTIDTRVGVVAIRGSRETVITDLVVRPTDSAWKKFYCFLSEEVNIADFNSTFRVIFSAASNGDRAQEMALDNIRLVTTADR